jgi:mutator protein MutT
MSPAPDPENRGAVSAGQSTILNVAAGLLFRSGRLLLTQRRAGDHLGGLWEFPGGKREPGEGFEECLRRELREELGIEVRVGRLVMAVEHAYPERTVHIRFHRCTLLAGEPEPLGCAGLAWVTATELGAYAFPAADATLLDLLRSTPDLWRKDD